jgi:GDSL-like Lipase/Acylhydrolase family
MSRSPSDRSQPDLPPDAPWQRFAVIGDTFTAHTRSRGQTQVRQPWADTVSAELRRRQPNLAYLNLSKQNFASSQVRVGQLQRLLAFSPDLAAICYGYDDVVSDSFDIGRFESELVRILLALRHIDCTVLLIGIFDITGPHAPNARKTQLWQRIESICSRTPAVATRFGAIYVDMAARIMRDGAACTDDGERLNSRGHEIIASETIRQLDNYLRGAD